MVSTPAINMRVTKVGDTPLIKSISIGGSIGLPHLYFKTESANPTHTQKDRAALALVMDARNSGYLGLTIGTCGNFGASLAIFCNLYDLQCTVFMPGRYKGARGREMEQEGAVVIYTDKGYEEAVAESANYALINKLYDANPTSLRAAHTSIEAYIKISSEIDRDIIGEVESVWVAVGNGTTLAGVSEGFRLLGMNPIVGAVSSKDNNAILTSFDQKAIVELDPESLTETHVNEPLLNHQAFQVNEALEALYDRGKVYGATDAEMLHAAETIRREEDIFTQPASASVLAGLIAHKDSLQKSKSHVLILTS